MGLCEAPGFQALAVPCKELMRTSKELLIAAVAVTTQSWANDFGEALASKAGRMQRMP